VGTALSYCAALNDSIRFSTASFVEGVCGDALTTGVTFTSNYAASDISITRSGSGSNNSNLTGDRTYTRGAFTGPPAGAVYTDATKLNWNFSGGWKFISAYSYPVLSWQTTPPADPSLF
jgi:hypothetical protein